MTQLVLIAIGIGIGMAAAFALAGTVATYRRAPHERPWIPCDGCESPWCLEHEMHAFECPCPAVDVELGPCRVLMFDRSSHGGGSGDAA